MVKEETVEGDGVSKRRRSAKLVFYVKEWNIFIYQQMNPDVQDSEKCRTSLSTYALRHMRKDTFT